MAKPYFTREAYFTNPARDFFLERATRLARPRYRVAARTRAPKQSTGLFFSLRSCPVLASSCCHSKNKNTATAASSHTGIVGAVHSRFLLFCEAGKLPTYRLRKILSRLLYHRRWQKARKKHRNFGGNWGGQYVKYSSYDEWEITTCGRCEV